ncbi:hypothetical protein CLOM_g19694 [Closterium sp. NIES-68]|nr:hypothetical protein CLOM_g19694 [Closterium sp. NIES-68]GJP73526.1 hypothetical protein CLOP_g4228 [Closterium sp. NIES-67]GJP80557.1 hypothetical protein CLOP_g10760 [Closterium sp. NIES-67]
MACVGAESACVDVDALFSNCWEQNDSLTSFVCNLISLPRLVDFKWTSSSNQVAAKAAPLLVEAPADCVKAPAVSVDAPAVSVEAPAVSVEAPAVSVEAPAVSVEAPAVSVEAPAVSVEAPAVSVDALAVSVVAPAVSVVAPAVSVVAPAVSVVAPAVSVVAPALSVVAPAVSVVALAVSVDTPLCSLEASLGSIEGPTCSAEDASWLGLEPEEVASSFPVAEAYQDVKMGSEEQQGVKMGEVASSRWCSMSRSESSCSSHSACLIDLPWDSCSSSSADSLCSTLAEMIPEATGVKRGIGRSICSTGKRWILEGKGCGKAEEESTFSNQLYGDDDEDDQDGEDYSSRRGYTLHGTGNVCYMNQLYMDEEDEEERRSLAASGISVGIGRFGARRRITGSSSRVTLRRMSSVLRQS